VSDKTIAAFQRPMIGHRSGDFQKLYATIHPRLQELFGTAQPVFLSTSSAWGVMEGAVRNLVGKKVLTCMCGAFSDKWFDVARRCGKDAEPLEDFLGDARLWIDRFMKQGGGYPIKGLGRHQFSFRGNWKIQLENTTDGYHFPIVHRSWMASVDAETADMMSFMTDPTATTHDLGNGHSVMQMVPEHSDLDEDDGTEPLQERFMGLVESLKAQHLDNGSIRRLVRAMHGTGFNLNLFPNVSMSISFLRVLRPISADETVIEHVALGPDGPGEIVDPVNRERLRVHEHFQGPFGFGTPDDSEGWDRVQRGAQAAPEMPIMVNRGLAREKNSPEGWPTSHVTDETGMRAAYNMWKRMMSHD
jgi:hypothetical protein